MIDIVKQQLEAMCAQEQALEDEVKRLSEQLLLSRGARQMLEHVLTLHGAAQVAPVEQDRTDAE